jgi:hypothetical protein
MSVLLACHRHQESANRAEGHLDVAWSGKNHGKISGPATARWCGVRRVLEIQVVKGDTGVAIALYPGAKMTAGTYQVLDPAKAESLPPAAGIALRWLGSTVVQGFRGDTGRIVVQRSASGQLSGRLSARASSVVDTQRVSLSGTFQDLAVTRDSLGCAAQADSVAKAPESVDTGVH